MRSVLAATILAVPAVLSAQAVHSGVSHLVASVDAPAFAFQASAINAGVPHVANGLIAPVRLNALKLAPSIAPTPNGQIVVEFTVDTAGVPQDVAVKQGLTPDADARVIQAVRQMRYTPGQLHGQAVAVPVTLRVAFND